MKKIIATVLAMVMALALCTTAFAATYTEAYKWNETDKKWEEFDLTGKTISYTSAVENKTNNKVTSGSVGYYDVAGTKYVEVKSDDDSATLRMKVDGTLKYLAVLGNVDDAAYTLIGTKVESSTACGKISVATGKTLYVSSNQETATYYVGDTDGQYKMLVDGKVVKVNTPAEGDYTKNSHSFKLVSTSTSAGVTTGTAKCEKCGQIANVTNKLSAIPSGASSVAGTAETFGAGLYAYWTEGSTTPSTGTTTTSPKTFDAGIAMYVGMALTSVAGSAVVIGKKKEF